MSGSFHFELASKEKALPRRYRGRTFLFSPCGKKRKLFRGQFLIMIISLNIKLVDGHHEGDWKCEIELDEDKASLGDLHQAIQDAVGFDNDHPYDFFVARGPRSSRRKNFPCDNSGHLATGLKELYPLENSNRVFYRFDFGDEWIFQIGRSRKKPKSPEAGKTYPRVVSEEGTKPTQYLR